MTTDPIPGEKSRKSRKTAGLTQESKPRRIPCAWIREDSVSPWLLKHVRKTAKHEASGCYDLRIQRSTDVNYLGPGGMGMQGTIRPNPDAWRELRARVEAEVARRGLRWELLPGGSGIAALPAANEQDFRLLRALAGFVAVDNWADEIANAALSVSCRHQLALGLAAAAVDAWGEAVLAGVPGRMAEIAKAGQGSRGGGFKSGEVRGCVPRAVMVAAFQKHRDQGRDIKESRRLACDETGASDNAMRKATAKKGGPRGRPKKQ
ncbi:hypothetical protein LBMAG53_22760 [Planctomycetota bacterium]|nr:hypothetical protein LBMAG53_22760 [Planctomycetota bacterium]